MGSRGSAGFPRRTLGLNSIRHPPRLKITNPSQSRPTRFTGCPERRGPSLLPEDELRVAGQPRVRVHASEASPPLVVVARGHAQEITPPPVARGPIRALRVLQPEPLRLPELRGESLVPQRAALEGRLYLGLFTFRSCSWLFREAKTSQTLTCRWRTDGGAY